MRFSSSIAASAALFLSGSSALNILMSNDDGFGSANIREFKKQLDAMGHNTIIVAPAVQQSGKGGSSSYTGEANLTGPSEYDLIPAGAPSIGADPHDSSIWYYNGTPAACVFVGLDYVLPRYGNFSTPDLVVAGPNFGTNPGPFLYTLSGTLGATYAAVGRSIPAIAFSASNDETPYTAITNSSNTATYVAQVSAKIVKSFVSNTPKGQAILPLGYGINVNIPPLTDAMHDPPVVKTRLTGNADTDIAVWNATTGTFHYGNLEPPAAGVNTCLNGDCSLPGETYIVEGGEVSVSVFSVDYDAPSNAYTTAVFNKLKGIASNTTASRRRTRRSVNYSHP
ncbi:sure-like protein [Aulographum hederae CBS 113979]|uniref:Sure-like protein n=1 Tax=Aulographum hederae CBS 113979 TaxID=1176131 RepID=A0A6G1H2L9_9PEZI|nr:sure-like protein [Aulographum hederae CBS 113979]